MKLSHDKLELQMKMFSCKSRISILAYLKKAKHGTVGEIANNVGLHLETVSQHLAKLRTAGIVERKKRNKYASYRLSLKQNEITKSVLRML